MQIDYIGDGTEKEKKNWIIDASQGKRERI